MKSRQGEAPTRSQLLPLAGEWQALMAKPYFVPSILLCAAIALLFTYNADSAAVIRVWYLGVVPVGVPIYTVVLALFIVAGGAFAAYRMAGKPKAWWMMPVVAVFTAFLISTPLLRMLHGVFDTVAGARGSNDSLITAFIKVFFGPGITEELLKAVPVALGVWLGAKLLPRLAPQHPARQFAVLEPLDGILIGVASGFGFAFSETVLQYVPGVIVNSGYTVDRLVELFNGMGFRVRLNPNQSTLSAIRWLFETLVEKVGLERATYELLQIERSRQGLGLQLMIPRLLSDIFGHAAYAGIFGYFIGLAVLRPVARAKTVLIGLLAAASLHALWDTLESSLFVAFALSVAAFVGLAVTMMKARQLSPQRSQLVASQLIDRWSDRAVPATPPTPATQPLPTGTPAMAPAPVMPAAATARPAPAPASITWDDDSALRLIEIGSARVPGTAGNRLYERQTPGLRAARGDGIVAEVTAHPDDPARLGLKNLSDSAWSLTLADGTQRELQPGRSIQLAEGLQIRMGELTARVR